MNKNNITVVNYATKIDNSAIELEYLRTLAKNKIYKRPKEPLSEKMKDGIMIETPSAKLLRKLNYPDSIFDLENDQTRNYMIELIKQDNAISNTLMETRIKMKELRDSNRVKKKPSVG